MAAERLNVGDRAGPYDLVLDIDMAAAFALAALDDNPRYFDGSALPPTAIATQTYSAQFAAIFELVPESVFAAARGGVHGRHELLLHRPMVPGEQLRTMVEMHSARSSRGNLRITLLHKTYDTQEQLVVERWWTTVMLGTTAGETGPDLPDHGIDNFDWQHPMAEEVVRIDLDMARRYAQISGDFSEHHFDVDAARRSGYERPLPSRPLHNGSVRTSRGPDGVQDDPSRLQRFAVRFASPAFLDQNLRFGSSPWRRTTTRSKRGIAPAPPAPGARPCPR